MLNYKANSKNSKFKQVNKQKPDSLDLISFESGLFFLTINNYKKWKKVQLQDSQKNN